MTIFLGIISIMLLCAVVYLLAKQKETRLLFQDQLQEAVAAAREDSLKKSRSTISGNVTETLAPLIPGFPFEGRDCKQYGSPLDYIIFDGMSRYRDTGEGEIKIVLCDIKTGNSQLTPVEKAIKEAVEAGRMEWVTLRMDLDRGGLVPVKHRKKKNLDANVPPENQLNNSENTIDAEV